MYIAFQFTQMLITIAFGDIIFIPIALDSMSYRNELYILA